jgi:hypothetical protein
MLHDDFLPRARDVANSPMLPESHLAGVLVKILEHLFGPAGQ